MSAAEFQQLQDYSQLEEAVEAGAFVLFKHSPSCGVSARAYRQLSKFLQDPSAPIYLVDVVANRDLSRQVAERLGVRHESPQAILVRDGKAEWNASHFRVTSRALRREVAKLTQS